MKLSIISTALFLFCSSVFAQDKTVPDSLGLPGDNFNLATTLDVFQKCATLEEFEKKINSADLKLNNLDLNNDQKTDYIRVVEHMEGTAHAIVLQVTISEKENQDIAVIEVDKNKKGEITVQIIGDKELYGKDYILEPKAATDNSNTKTSTPNPGYTGNTTSDTIVSADGKNVTINNTTNNYSTTTVANPATPPPAASSASTVTAGDVIVAAALWPIMGLLFVPAYIAYSSPYHYGYYPPYWSPWPPVYYHAYYARHPPVYAHYHTTVIVASPHCHAHYAPHKSTSVVVVNNNKNGNYNNSYNRNSNNTGNKPGNTNSNNKPANTNVNNKPSNTGTNNKPANTGTTNKPSNSGNNTKPASNNSSAKPATNDLNQSQNKDKGNTSKPSQSSTQKSGSNTQSKAQPSQHAAPQNRSRPSGGGRKR